MQVVKWLSVCGNGIVEGTEECDDGDTDDGDGCSAQCKVQIPSLEKGKTQPGGSQKCARKAVK